MKNKLNAKKIILSFLITLLLVLLLGLGTMVAINQHARIEQDNRMSFVEAIPESERKIAVRQDNQQGAVEQEEEKPVGKYEALLMEEEALEAQSIYPLRNHVGDEIQFTFAGDILFDPGYSMMNSLRMNDYQLDACIEGDVLELMRSADVMMLNNEFPFSDGGTALLDKAFTFRAPTETVKYLKEMGVDMVSLANNHAYDYGEQALVDTLGTLEEAGILYVGAGRNKKEAQQTKYFLTPNMKIGVVSATQIEKGDTPDTKGATEDKPGVFRCWNNEELLEQIRIAKENSDFVLVYIHWGTENQTEIDWAQEQQAPQMVEAGADLIIGDHPHCLQKIEVIQGVPVVYSLGNFWFNSKTLDTCLFNVTINQEGIQSMQFVPCLQSGCKTTLLEGTEKERVISFMNSISPGIQIDLEGNVSIF